MKRPTTVSRTEFAQQIGVGVKQVNRYVRENVLDGRAVIRDGREVRINPTVAKRQLADRLSAPTSGRRLHGASIDGGSRNRSLSSQLKAEQLRHMRHRNARLEQELAAFEGRWADRADVDRVLARLPGMMLDFIERAMPILVDAVAATFNLPRDEVAALIDAEMRRVRARAAAADGRPMGNGVH